jgi:hypothetical protein
LLIASRGAFDRKRFESAQAASYAKCQSSTPESDQSSVPPGDPEVIICSCQAAQAIVNKKN